MSHKRFTPRRWPIWLIFAVMIVMASGLAWRLQHKPDDEELRVIQGESVTELPPSPKAKATADPVVIRQSRATAIYLPDTQKGLVRYPVRKLTGCKEVIVPPLSGPRIGDVFDCMDYAQPGTNSPSFTVLAGHSSLRFPTVMNGLLSQGDSLRGREVWLQTRASGSQKLAYRITDTAHIDNDALPMAEEVWGTPQRPTPNRLVLVTCRWNEAGEIIGNFVITAELEGVR